MWGGSVFDLVFVFQEINVDTYLDTSLPGETRTLIQN